MMYHHVYELYLFLLIMTFSQNWRCWKEWTCWTSFISSW